MAISTCEVQGNISSISWSPRGDRLAVATDNRAEILDVANNHQVLQTFQADAYHILGIAWNPQRNELASASGNGQIRRWDVDSGRVVAIYAYAPPPPTVTLPDGSPMTVTEWAQAVAWSPDGQYLAAVGADTSIKAWDTVNDTFYGEFELGALKQNLNWVGWSPDASTLAAVGQDNLLLVIDPVTLDWMQTGSSLIFSAGRGKTEPELYSGAWSPDSAMLAIGGNNRGRDGNIIVEVGDFSRRTSQILQPFIGSVRALAWSPGGQWLAAGGTSGVAIWDVSTWRRMQTITTVGEVKALAWHPRIDQLTYGMVDSSSPGGQVTTVNVVSSNDGDEE